MLFIARDEPGEGAVRWVVCVCPESQLCFEALGVLLPPLACLCSASGGKANAAGRVWGCGMSLGQRGTGFLLGVNTGCVSAPMS